MPPAIHVAFTKHLLSAGHCAGGPWGGWLGRHGSCPAGTYRAVGLWSMRIALKPYFYLEINKVLFFRPLKNDILASGSINSKIEMLQNL